MKRMIPFLLVLLLLAGCGGNTSDGSYEQITQEEAKEMMDTWTRCSAAGSCIWWTRRIC